MISSPYQKLVDFLTEKVKELEVEKQALLTDSDLDKVFFELRGLLNEVGVKKLLFKDSNVDFTELDWRRARKEIESKINVKHEVGSCLQGKKQRKRDITWWTSKVRQEKASEEYGLYYWSNYEELLKKTLPNEVVNTIDVDTDFILNNIPSPTEDSFSSYGMVVGHVQSGKTGNYSALVCKAADAGYKLIIILAGGLTNLRNQTQKRMNESFIGKSTNKKGDVINVGVGVGRKPISGKMPISLTTKDRDFDKRAVDRDKLSLNLSGNNPYLMVLKKNTSTLKNVMKWLDSHYPNQIEDEAVLIIDDESDYASINTKKDEEFEATAINEGIRKIVNKFKRCAYVAYTATPYANILMDHEINHESLGIDLFPRDFIYALNAPSNYFGAKKIFHDDTGQDFLVPVEDYIDFFPIKHDKNLQLEGIPESLKEAVRNFLLVIAIRDLRGQSNKHNSMLIHATRFTNVHKLVTRYISEYLKSLQKTVDAFGMSDVPEDFSIDLRLLKETYEIRCSSNGSDIEFIWEEVIKKLTLIINTIVVREVHQERTIPLEYRDDARTNAIVVGGTSLARGFTLEGLSISYFLRNTVYYDTLYQMGRWFGYRPEYEDLCRIYMPYQMMDNFAHIYKATDELMTSFDKMIKEEMTPEDFGLAILEHPESILQVTARNKSKHAGSYVHKMNLNGALKEVVRFPLNHDGEDKNFDTIINLAKTLGNKFSKEGTNHYIYREIEKNIIEDFISRFKVLGGESDSLGVTSLMPRGHILEYLKNVETNWDVIFYNGSMEAVPLTEFLSIKKGKRKVSNLKNTVYFELQSRKASSGTPEQYALTQEQRKELTAKDFKEANKSKYIRERLSRPILMIYVLDVTFDDTTISHKLPGFGVCFPDKGLSSEQTVSYFINKVMKNNLEQQIQFIDGGSDD